MHVLQVYICTVYIYIYVCVCGRDCVEVWTAYSTHCFDFANTTGIGSIVLVHLDFSLQVETRHRDERRLVDFLSIFGLGFARFVAIHIKDLKHIAMESENNIEK